MSVDLNILRRLSCTVLLSVSQGISFIEKWIWLLEEPSSQIHMCYKYLRETMGIAVGVQTGGRGGKKNINVCNV